MAASEFKPNELVPSSNKTKRYRSSFNSRYFANSCKVKPVLRDRHNNF